MRVITCIAALVLMWKAASSQDKTINVWAGSIPGSIDNPSYKEQLFSDKYWTWMRFVTVPTMDVYTPPEGKANGTAVIICPGGAYWALAIVHEGKQVAAWLNSLGITAFVLKYRLPDDSIMTNKTIAPLQDAQEAIRQLRRDAGQWRIDPHKIGVMGFSAGGHLASTISTHFDDSVYSPADTTSARPDFSLLIYPVITMDSATTHADTRKNLLGQHPAAGVVEEYSNERQVTASTPPAFIVHSIDDNAVPVQNSINYALALKKYNVPCELHVYKSGGHGYGLGRSDDTESSWPEACRRWLAAGKLID